MFGTVYILWFCKGKREKSQTRSNFRMKEYNVLFPLLGEFNISPRRAKDSHVRIIATSPLFAKTYFNSFVFSAMREGVPLRSVLEKREFTIARVKEEMKEGMTVVIGGIIEEVKNIITKKNEVMAFLRLADLTASIEVVVFPKVYEEFKKLLVAESCIAIKGRFSTRNGTPSLIAEKTKELK
jgi:DNA polymerase III alpha subunit